MADPISRIAEMRKVSEDVIYQCLAHTARRHGIDEMTCAEMVLEYLSARSSTRVTATEGHCGIQGRRSTMEDAAVMTTISGNRRLYGIFDGHGGSVTSNVAAEQLPELLSNELSNASRESIPTKIVEAFIDFDRMLYERSEGVFAEQQPIIDGSTALVAVRDGDTLYVANLGDSRAIIFDDLGNLKYQTVDQKPDDPMERARIDKAGGFVTNGRVAGILAVARALGDFQPGMKVGPKGQYLGVRSPVGVEPRLDVVSLPKGGGRRFLVMACDGLWDVRTSEDVAQEVAKMFRDKAPLMEICKHLANDAVNNRGSTDNVSVLLVKL